MKRLRLILFVTLTIFVVVFAFPEIVSYQTDTVRLSSSNRAAEELAVPVRAYPIPRQIRFKGQVPPFSGYYPDPTFTMSRASTKNLKGTQYRLQSTQINYAFKPELQRSVLSIKVGETLSHFELLGYGYRPWPALPPGLLVSNEDRLVVILNAHRDHESADELLPVLVEVKRGKISRVVDPTTQALEWDKLVQSIDTLDYPTDLCLSTHRKFWPMWRQLFSVECE